MKRNILIVLAIIVSVAGCKWIDTLLGEGGAVPVTVEKVKVVDRVETINMPAKFENGKRAEIRVSEDSTIDRIYVEEGETVSADQSLFRLSEENMGLQLGQLKANLRDKESELDKLEYLSTNKDRLLDEEEIDNDRYDSIENEVDNKESEIEKINLDIRTLESKQEKILYRSPIAGVVEYISNVSPGSTISREEPAVIIVETNPMIAEFQLTPDEAAAIKPGMPVVLKLISLANKKVGGTVKSISNERDTTTGLIEIKALVPNDNGTIKAGMAAEAEITSRQELRFFLIAKDAILSTGRERYVYVVEKGIAHKKRVILHRTVGNSVEISSGLDDNDLIVINGNEKLKEGTVVELWGR